MLSLRLGHLAIKYQLILSDDDSVCIISILLTTKYGPASLGPTKAKFTTKFQQSGIPMGEIITSKAPAQTFTSPRSIASIEILD
jgi:hypothetical protein